MPELNSLSDRKAQQGYPPRARSVGLLNEITGQQRNRIWIYQRYYALLSEGAAPL